MLQFLRVLAVLVLLGPVTAFSKNDPSVLVYNNTTGTTIIAQGADTVRPVASITKLMTAMVTLDYDKDLSKLLMLSNKVPSNLPRQQYTRLDLINAMLVRSDNAAAETLAEDYPGGRVEFIKRMNQQAKDWDMLHTHFEDASGLGAQNTSTAVDISNIITTASGYWLISDTSIKKQALFEAKVKNKIRKIILPHTNSQMLLEFDNIVTTKTGFTNPAGWCVALLVKHNRQEFVVVVLGSKNKLERRKLVEKAMHTHILRN
jgi:D-alanyl-D-alanine endopeptidase (penicillin-binding protein 7)